MSYSQFRALAGKDRFVKKIAICNYNACSIGDKPIPVEKIEAQLDAKEARLDDDYLEHKESICHRRLELIARHAIV